jgi:hypothetical protein
MIKWNRPGYFIPPTLAEQMRFKYKQSIAEEVEAEIVEVDEEDEEHNENKRL